ncbi:MAG: hypothetical protein ABI581_14625 [Sediminibacterium sp.]
MKSKTIAAIIIAAALLIFAFVKISGNKEQTFSIVGDWKIDSFYALKPKDTALVIACGKFLRSQ